MADVESNIHVNIDTSDALASLKLLQRQISAFHTQMAKSGTAAAAVAANQAQNLMNSINATGQFQASMRSVTSSTEQFTDALERNKLTSREYFRYTGAATKTFGRLFRSEFETINKVARERVKDLQTQYIKMGRGANGALQAIAVRPLTLDMKNLGTQTAIAAQRQQLLNQLLKQGSTNLLNFGKNTQWAGRQLMVGFTVPLAMLATTASKTFMKLEEQAIRFKRVYGELFTTQEETDVMVKNIQLLAKEYTKYGVAVEETMKMAADAAAMGKMGAELLAQVAQATRLAVLGGVEQTQALETTISVTNAFGVATEELAAKIDFLNAVENQTVVSIEDLTIAIPKAGPVVQQLGGDVEDLAFFLTAMKEGGINASEGANALKSGLASLINPSEKASKMLAGLGVNIKGIVEGNKGDVKATVIDFAAALDTLDPLNRARAIEQLFGKFQFSRLSTLFQNVIGEGTQAARVLKLANATTEELAILSERELNRVQNTTTYKFKKSMEDLKVAIAPVGEQFLKALTPIVEFVGKILEKFSGMSEGSKKFITILTVAVAGVGPVLLMSVGLIANAIANIIKLFTHMKSAYNRTGSASKILGEQTNYLTKEQLEASAVAASLDQVHQKLNQTFTSEATAVNNLANAYRRAIAAQMGFTGPPAGKRMPGPKKFSIGTRRVPGSGNQDTVPAMLTPGEAVIPAGAAQDPGNKPVIARMIAGETVQGFSTGEGDVQPVGTPKAIVKDNNVTNRTHVGGKSTPKSIQDVIDANPHMTPDQRNKLITMAQIFKSQGMEAVTTTKHGLIFEWPEWMNKQMPTVGVSKQEFMDEWRRRGAGKWHLSGMTPVQAQAIDDAFLRSFADVKGPMITDGIVDRIFKEEIPKIVSPNDEGLKKAQRLYATDYLFNMGKGLGNTPERSAEILQRAASTIDPDTGKTYIKSFTIESGPGTGAGRTDKIVTRSSTVTLHDGTYFGIPLTEPTTTNMNRLGAGTAPAISQTPPGAPVRAPELIAENMERAQSQQERLKEISRIAETTKSGKKKPTDFGKQIATSSGRSFDVREIGGVYEKPDGKRVFVKPMMSELDALAEQRATDFARKVQGLDAPVQKVRTMIDPTDPEGKRKIIVLESPFDKRFDPNNIPKKFTQAEYFKQLVAANLRGDRDLKAGNLGGNIMTDGGNMGVFDSASGAREFSKNMPSLEQMAEENLKGIPEKSKAKPQNSPNWFANATRDIALNLTPDQYDREMKKEISRQIALMEPYVAKMSNTDPLKPEYLKMLERLKVGLSVDWRRLHQQHSRILVKPDEVLEDSKGKTKPIPTEPNNGAFKSSTGSPKDTRLAPAELAPAVRQRPVIRGRSDAPDSMSTTASAVVSGARGSIAEAKAVGSTIGTTLSQSAAAASRTALYGTGPIDADAKSVRRRLQKVERQEAKQQRKTQAMARASKTKLYGAEPGTAITPFEKSLRRKGYSKSQIAEQVAYQKKVISEKAAANVTSRPSIYDRTIGRAKKEVKTFRAQEHKGTYLRDRIRNRPNAGKGGMGMGGAMGLASGVAMIGSMAPGKVGEISTKLMMPLMGMAMIMPMLQNKFSALAVGVGAVVAAYAYQRMAFDKAQDAALELTDAMGAGTRAIKSLSEFSTQVGAGEIMAKRRKDSFSPFNIKTGKKTFGESYMEGEGGKALAKNVVATTKMSGKDIAQDQVVSQLSTAVASGVLTSDQARSIAANLGTALGDYAFGIQVNAKLIELLGPNGENFLKEGVELEVKLLRKTRESMSVAATNAEEAGGWTGKDIGKTAGYSGLGLAAGGVAGMIAGGMFAATAATVATAAAGTAVGVAAGAAAGSIVPVVGTAIGAAIGLGVGVFLSRKDRNKRIGEASGASIAMQKIALQQQQELNDSVELRYQKELAIAKAKGDQVAIDKLTDQYELDQVALLEENEALVSAIQKSYTDAEGATQNALMTGVDKAVTKQYAGTALEDVVPLAQTQINDSGLSGEMQYTLKMQMASGQIDPMQMLAIFEKFGDDKASVESVVSIVGKFGGAFANSVMGIVGMFEDKDQAAKFVADIKIKSPKEAQKQLELFQRISQSAPLVDKQILLNYYNSNPDEAKKIQDSIELIDDLKGKSTIDFIAKTEIFGAEEMAALKADQEYFDSLPAEQQKTYLQNMKVMFGMEGDPAMQLAYQNWLGETTGSVGGVSIKGNAGKSFADYATAMTYKATEAAGAEPGAPTTTNTNTNTKVQSSPLDDLVKKLRDVRKNQIKVTEGWSASRKALDSLFGGKKTLDAFSGIENDIRGLGGSEDLIELIVGMDPKMYEEKKNSLFKFDNKGNIIALKKDAKNIQEALNSVAMGDFNSKTEAETNIIEDQAIAFTKLASIGIPVADAYSMVENAGLAQAIASEKNSKSVAKLAANYKILTAAQLEAAAVKGVKTDIAQFKKDRVQEARIKSKFDSTTAAAIGSDDNLKAMESAIVAQEAKIKRAIKKGANRADVEKEQAALNEMVSDFNERITQLKNTIGFMQDMFDRGYGNATEEFDVQETELQLKFKVDTKEKDKIVTDAQNAISAIQYKVDDKEAALKGIEDQEEKINEKYDKRIEALDEIEKANSAISNQQKGQLSLAEALTSGDIAAAARAAQEMSAQAAADAVQKQRDAVEQSREFELNSLTGLDKTDGKLKTRKQLEEEIKNLEDEVFKIEEEKIEPAQEFIRLKQIQLDKDVEGLTVLGRTRDAWEAIKNQVDLALIKSAAFVDSMGLAISTQANLIAGYKAEVGGKDGAFINTQAFVPEKGFEGETPADRAAREKAAAELKAAADKKIADDKIAADKIAADKVAKDKEIADKAALEALEKTTMFRGRGGFGRYLGMMAMSSGGVVPSGFESGAYAKGTDTVPAMLTPGEYVLRKDAVNKYGVKNLDAMNVGYYHKGGPVGHRHGRNAPNLPKLVPGTGVYNGSTFVPARYETAPKPAPAPTGNDYKSYVGGDGLNRNGQRAGWRTLFEKKNWESTANFFGLPSIAKTGYDFVKYGANPLSIPLARLTGQEMKSTVGDNFVAGLSLLPIPLTKLAKPVVNLISKIVPRKAKDFLANQGIDIFSKISAKVNKPATNAVATTAAKPKKVMPEKYGIDYDSSGSLHKITVKDGDDVAGYLTWDKETGVVENLHVFPGHLDKGIATAMYKRAQEIAPITHSPHRTPAGDAFAYSIGDPVVPLNDGPLPGYWTNELLDAAKARASARAAEEAAKTAAKAPKPKSVMAGSIGKSIKALPAAVGQFVGSGVWKTLGNIKAVRPMLYKMEKIIGTRPINVGSSPFGRAFEYAKRNGDSYEDYLTKLLATPPPPRPGAPARPADYWDGFLSPKLKPAEQLGETAGLIYKAAKSKLVDPLVSKFVAPAMMKFDALKSSIANKLAQTKEGFAFYKEYLMPQLKDLNPKTVLSNYLYRHTPYGSYVAKKITSKGTTWKDATMDPSAGPDLFASLSDLAKMPFYHGGNIGGSVVNRSTPGVVGPVTDAFIGPKNSIFDNLFDFDLFTTGSPGMSSLYSTTKNAGGAMERPGDIFEMFFPKLDSSSTWDLRGGQPSLWSQNPAAYAELEAALARTMGIAEARLALLGERVPGIAKAALGESRDSWLQHENLRLLFTKLGPKGFTSTIDTIVHEGGRNTGSISHPVVATLAPEKVVSGFSKILDGTDLTFFDQLSMKGIDFRVVSSEVEKTLTDIVTRAAEQKATIGKVLPFLGEGHVTSRGRKVGRFDEMIAMATGGLVPNYFGAGGFAIGTDTVPAMLTPGEFVMSKYAVDSYGIDNMKKINSGADIGGAVYNNTYTLTVNAKTDANPNEIAQAVMSQIKTVNDRRVRGINTNVRN